MRINSVTVSKVLCCLSLVTLAGCFSSGATPPAANTPCQTSDGCPSGYQCLSATNGGTGRFCCKEKNNCGPAGSGGSSGGSQDGAGHGSGGTISTDGPSSKGGATNVASAGSGGGGYAGEGGGIVDDRTGLGGTTGGVATGGMPSGGIAGGGITAGDGGGAGGRVDAPGDSPAPGPDAPTLLPVGKTCAIDTDCALGNCVDGVCCNKSKTTCAGCNACTNLLTGLDDGTCGPVSVGKDPHDTCADETATSQCGNDGTCDGKGACRKVSNSHVCTQASCSSDGKTFTPVTTCDGNGACTTVTAQSCAPFQCATTGCLQTCTTQADCVGSTYCNTSVTPAVCATKKTNGTMASQPYECTSGVVADGVCCNQACSGCSACTLALNMQTGASVADGQCLAVVAGQVGHSTCTASPPCGLDGMCDGNGNCRYTATGTSCAADSCPVSTLMKTTKACDSTHNCAATTSACPGALMCASSGTGCKLNCSADSDCVSGNYCASGTCASKQNDGAACTVASQCKNANCVSGICCNTACGQCNSCSTGTCKPVTDLTSCGGGSVCVGGSCITCAQGSTCTPSTPCLTGTISCSSGTAQCIANASAPQPDGTSCVTGKVCTGGSCQSGCWIDETFRSSGFATGPGSCQICNPSKSTTAWSNNDGASQSCGSCGGSATCVNMQPGSCSKDQVTFWQDNDADGYGNPLGSTTLACPGASVAGYAQNSGDCDDSDAQWHPGKTRCESYDWAALTTCASNGTNSSSTCSTGCAGGQCRSFATVNTAGSVTCGTLTCPASQGCSFSAPQVTPPSCGIVTSWWYESCDGPNDCSSGQVCCHVMPAGGSSEHTECMASSSCPYSNQGGSGNLVCTPGQACTTGTCQSKNNTYLSIYECQ